MDKFNLMQILSSMDKKPLAKHVFCTTNHLKAQVMLLQAGHSIPPCKMDNDVLFYFLKGNGTITIDNKSKPIEPGDCIIVPNEAGSRSINAESDMEILAVQGIKH